jgi:hypothetical protein
MRENNIFPKKFNQMKAKNYAEKPAGWADKEYFCKKWDKKLLNRKR